MNIKSSVDILGDDHHVKGGFKKSAFSHQVRKESKYDDGDESDKEKPFNIDDVDAISMGHISVEEQKNPPVPGTSSEEVSPDDPNRNKPIQTNLGE